MSLLHLQGILPPVLLAVLMMLLPIILRLLARFEGIPKYTGLELSLMTRYFLFLFVVSSKYLTIFESAVLITHLAIVHCRVALFWSHCLPSNFFE